MADIVERVKKLLELSKSDNEHEAAQAAGRAAALMAEHQISEAMLAVTSDDDDTSGVPEDIITAEVAQHRLHDVVAQRLSRRPQGRRERQHQHERKKAACLSG